MILYVCTGTVLVLMCVLVLVYDVLKPKNYPPGPQWLPIIGCYKEVNHIYSHKKYYHLVWSHFQNLYGPVVGLKLGFDRIVIVSGYNAVQQVMLKKEFEGRPDGFFFRLRSLGERLGVVFVDGPFMREQRRFCMQQLRQFGLGKAEMYDVITKEALEVVDLIMLKCQEGPIQVRQLFDVSTLNTIWTMIAGYRFPLNDKRLLKLLDLVHAGFHLVDMSGGLLNQMPFLRFFAPSLSGYNSLRAIVDEMIEFLQEVVKNHRPTDGKDFISVFLQQIKSHKRKPDNTFTEKQLLILLEDFFMAGTETTSSTLSFVIFYLVKYPQVQDKIHSELNRVVAPDQIPMIEHREKLVYLEATIMEVQRHANPVPVTIPHCALEDTSLMNYTVPKGTFILPSLWSVHMEENYWTDPFTFRPERFIDKNGKLLQDNHFMPFGIGKRRCIGEILAKTSLFLFISVLLQKFRLQPVTDDLSIRILDGVTLAPSPFEVKFIPR